MGTQRVPVCQVDELRKGEMKQVSVRDKEGDKDVLLVHLDNGEIRALAPHCSHYGAPLATGVLHQDRVMCPWHHACFSADSGKQLEPPGADDLAQHSVVVEDGTVYLERPDFEEEHVAPSLFVPFKAQDNTCQTFVIVGAGAAGSAAAEMLRQIDFQGKIVMLSAEAELPYDRTKLSKAFLQSADLASDEVNDEIEGADLLRSPQFYEKYGIDIKTNAKVSKLEVDSQQITYGDGNTLKYDALLLAMGGQTNPLPIVGSDLKNVFTLRRIEEAQEILRAAKKSQRAVIIGTGFIGMEVAASLAKQGLDVTVVAPNQVPFENVLGTEVGRMFQQKHESHGVTFKLGSKVTAIHGTEQVESVELENGEQLLADMVVVGIGVKPATAFIEDSIEDSEQLALDEKDNSILVNQYLQAAPGIYAAGDIAQFPHFITGEPTRIEHWRLAMQHGRTAACNMMGQQIPFEAIPYFWTEHFDAKLRYVGHAEQWDDVIIQGSLEALPLIAFYGQGDQVTAVAGVGCDRDLAAIEELMRIGNMPPLSEIKHDEVNWVFRMNEPIKPEMEKQSLKL